jgi:phosphoribosyl-AMP cyclohydrolase
MAEEKQNIFAERGSKEQIEEGTELSPKFDSQGLIPVVATDDETGDVLMFAYMNRESLARTIEIGEAVYYSRSRQELWHKGATSGHVQKVLDLRIDCDQDALWMRVRQQGGGACHVGFKSCFYRSIPVGAPGPVTLQFDEDGKAFDPNAVYGKK